MSDPVPPLLQRIKKRIRRRGFRLGLPVLVLLGVYWFALPSRLFDDPTSTVLYDREGRLLGARIAQDQQWRFPEGDEVPYKFRQCLIHFEDRYFEWHGGVNPVSMLRAAVLNIRAGHVVSGGSTISMQVIRLSRKDKARNLWEKFVEMMLASRMEKTYSKDEILALYASHAPFGSNVVGLEAAAWRYYGKPAAALSWGESATLAVLPNSPGLVYPGRSQQALRRKRDALLNELQASGIIDASENELARSEPLPGKPLPLPRLAPHLTDRALKEGFQGQRLQTTVDGHLQTIVTDIVARAGERNLANQIGNAAVLVLNVETGSVLAYVGNTSHRDKAALRTEVDNISAPRSTGSILKPFLYACMLNEGLILPNTLVPDIPIQLGSFNPENFNYSYDGAVPAHRALARSLNIPCVKMLQQYGIPGFHHQLRRLGMTTLTRPAAHYGLSLIIGGAEARLWDLAGMYASMARTLNHYGPFDSRYKRDDFHPPLYLLSQEERAVHRSGSDEHSLLDAGSIYLTFQAMVEVARPDEDAEWQLFSSSSRVAWKTGTSWGGRDAWAIGVTPDNVVAVWVGNSSGEGRPGLTGLSYAAPILFEVLKALPPAGWFYAPYDDLIQLEVCPESGYKAGPWCGAPDTMWVPSRGIRSTVCPYHRLVHLDASGRYQVSSDCESPGAMQHKAWFVLPPVMEHFFKQGHPEYVVLPPYRDDCREADGRSMDLIYPSGDCEVYIPKELSGERGRVVFRAAHRRPGTRVYWYVDENFLGVTRDFHQMGLAPAPGKHLLVLTDEYGERLERRFSVINGGAGN